MSKVSLKEAAVITFISKYGNIFIQLVINSILARLLTPDDYGVVAVITVFTGFFTLVADMGIGPAIIQNKTLNDKDISSIFNFTVISGVIVASIFCLLSYPLSLFYKEEIYIYLGLLMSLSIFFSVLNIVPNALLLKNKEFKVIGIRTISITFICGMITIILAFLKWKYYAIVMNSILVALFTFIFNYRNVDIQRSRFICKDSLQKISSYSKYQFGFGFVNYFSRNLDNLLIGKILGPIQLGFYDKAYKLMMYPISNLTYVITPVLHPILSDYQHDKNYIYKQYIKIVKILSLLGVFISVYCFYSADEAILIMFGNQWIESIGTFRILSLTIWTQMIMSSTGTIFQSLGETRYLFKTGYITAMINAAGIVIGLLLGKLEYIAIMICFTFNINLIITFYILVKLLNKSVISFFKLFIPELFISFIMIIVLNFSKHIIIQNILLSAIFKFLIAGISYMLGLYLTKSSRYFEFLVRKNR